MKILVTGAEGFIGRALSDELELHGHEVVRVDLLGPVQADMSIPDAVTWVLDTFQPDTVVHLAAAVGRVLCEDDVVRTVTANAVMTATIAHQCGERGIRLVYTSTSEIYGDHGDEMVDEDVEWKLPHNLYGLSKRWGEEVARLYAPENLVIIRPSMPYGPGAPPGRGRRAMDNLLHQALHQMPMVVHEGSERSWCWLGDLVRGYRLAIEHPEGGVYNIGRDDDPRPMLEIAQMACRITGSPESLIQVVPPPSNVTPVKRLSTQRIRDLGWEPEVELEDGINMLFDWIKHFDAEGNYLP